MSHFDRLGAKIPRCGARTRTGERCSESPAPHPRRAGYYVPSGRCRLHGGASTGPRTAEGKAVISAAARRMWNRAFEAEGKVIPSESLRARLSVFLDAWTWDQAMRATGLSRRTLLRIERGGYCEESELVAVRRAISVEFGGTAPGDRPLILALGSSRWLKTEIPSRAESQSHVRPRVGGR